MTEDEVAAIHFAAHLIVNHGLCNTGLQRDIIESAMLECAGHCSGSGVGGFEMWLAAFTALGEHISATAKMLKHI